MGLQQGSFSNAVVTVDNDGNVTRIKDGPRLQRVRTRGTQTDVTASRAFGGIYQNTSGSLMLVHGFGSTTGSAWVQINAFSDSVTPPTAEVWSSQIGATTAGATAGFSFPVPAGYYYKVTTGGSGATTLQKWWETIVS